MQDSGRHFTIAKSTHNVKSWKLRNYTRRVADTYPHTHIQYWFLAWPAPEPTQAGGSSGTLLQHTIDWSEPLT